MYFSMSMLVVCLLPVAGKLKHLLTGVHSDRRNRFAQLVVFLKHIHPMLRRQELDYRIYVINQVERHVKE
jgi:hypothetical protein